jgi:hypothetical protein
MTAYRYCTEHPETFAFSISIGCLGYVSALFSLVLISYASSTSSEVARSVASIAVGILGFAYFQLDVNSLHIAGLMLVIYAGWLSSRLLKANEGGVLPQAVSYAPVTSDGDDSKHKPVSEEDRELMSVHAARELLASDDEDEDDEDKGKTNQ